MHSQDLLGSGKSSFLHMLALLDSPTKGKFLLSDKDTKDLKEFEKDNIRKKKYLNNISR